MTNLRRLDLSGNENLGLLGEAGLEHIEGLGQLRELCLNQTYVRDSDLLHLRGIKTLMCVELAGTQVTHEGIDDLRAYRPDLEIALQWHNPLE